MKLRGTVIRRTFGRGSKSEHPAILLETPEGTFRLRRPDGNPFRDPVLDELVGRDIAAEGTLDDAVFLLSSWTVQG